MRWIQKRTKEFYDFILFLFRKYVKSCGNDFFMTSCLTRALNIITSFVFLFFFSMLFVRTVIRSGGLGVLIPFDQMGKNNSKLSISMLVLEDDTTRREIELQNSF